MTAPSPWQHFKSLTVSRALHDLQPPPRHDHDPLYQLARVAGVRLDQAQQFAQQPVSDQLGSIPILNSGWMHDHRQPNPIVSTTICRLRPITSSQRHSRVTGRERPIVVDTAGLRLAAAVHPADIQDRDGADAVLEQAAPQMGQVALLWADGPIMGRLRGGCKTGGVGLSRLGNARRTQSASPCSRAAGWWSGHSPGWPAPSAVIIDSQSVKTTGKGGPRL